MVAIVFEAEYVHLLWGHRDPVKVRQMWAKTKVVFNIKDDNRKEQNNMTKLAEIDNEN